MNKKSINNSAFLSTFAVKKLRSTNRKLRKASVFAVFCLAFILFSGINAPLPFAGKDGVLPESFSFAPKVEADNTYYNFSSGSLTLAITPATTNLITTNDDWTGVASVEGYRGTNLTATHGIDPQTVLVTEFASNSLPGDGDTNVNANKGNPSAFNAGGVTEFDTGTFLAIGFQGNVQANPYLVFYINTTGRSNVTVSYTVTDIDGGSNNSVSPLALQYRVGETGIFTNVPAAFIADTTVGPNSEGTTQNVNVTLPSDASNKPKVQIRLITTNAANTSGDSAPDEWIGINNVIIGATVASAASVEVGGRIYSPYGRPLAGATVTMFDSYGSIRTARSNPFGYYRFYDISAGETYIFEISSKRFAFPDGIRTLFVTENVDTLDFSAEQAAPEPVKGEIPVQKSHFLNRKF